LIEGIDSNLAAAESIVGDQIHDSCLLQLFASTQPKSTYLALALQLPFMQFSESMGNHDSKIVDAASVD